MRTSSTASMSALTVVTIVAITCACCGREPTVAANLAVPDDVEAVLEQVDALCARGENDVALEYVERAVGKLGDDTRLLERYNDLAFGLEKWDVALATARRLDRADTRQSPWNQLKAAEALLKLGRSDEALTCIETAVNERSFKRYQVFDHEVYDPVRGDGRFLRCVAAAKANIGIGATMPDFTVTTLDGRQIPLRSLAGKVVLVDFWATWCRPCVKELPNLQALYAKHSNEGFEIVGLSLDSAPATVDRYVEEKGIAWPICYLDQGWKDPIVTGYGVNALPSMWLYDRTGTLRFYNQRGAALRDAVEAIL